MQPDLLDIFASYTSWKYNEDTWIINFMDGSQNMYLLEGDEKALLIDTGWGSGTLRPYVERLTQKPVQVILTHGHLDHIQNTALLMERLGVPAALHPADLGLLTDQQSQPLSAQGPAGRLLLSLSRHSFQTQAFLPFTPTVELREGDSLAPWGVDARVLELPGHTAGSIGLDVEGHSLIVGDAMMNLFRPGPSCLCSDPAAQRDSIARIRSLGPRSLYFGHGRPAHLPG